MQAPPRALANLVDNFSDEGENCSNASDMIDAQLTSLDFGEVNWYVDSGAKKHIRLDKKVFGKLEVVERSSVKTVGGQFLFVKGKGHVTANGIKFAEVLYVHGLNKSFISVCSMTDDGYKLPFDSGQVHVL